MNTSVAVNSFNQGKNLGEIAQKTRAEVIKLKQFTCTRFFEPVIITHWDKYLYCNKEMVCKAVKMKWDTLVLSFYFQWKQFVEGLFGKSFLIARVSRFISTISKMLGSAQIWLFVNSSFKLLYMTIFLKSHVCASNKLRLQFLSIWTDILSPRGLSSRCQFPKLRKIVKELTSLERRMLYPYLIPCKGNCLSKRSIFFRVTGFYGLKGSLDLRSWTILGSKKKFLSNELNCFNFVKSFEWWLQE